MTDFVRPESMEVPEGGLASFLTATVGEWADDEVPQTGIAGLHSVADHLAEYGRYEDTYMIHASQGETVIPMAVLDENPRLKASLFAQMRSMGIDPERYVVGNELNSINPATGQPEFFLSRLWKGLKKAVKGVVKVVKRLAPIILSVALSTIMGPIAGTALGSGIGTLIQGGSFKDALKMAAIGGATAGLFKGIGGGFKGMKAGQGFGTGFKAGVASGLPGGVPYTPGAIPSPNVSANLQPVAGQGGINPDALARSGTGIVGPNHPYSTLQRGVSPSLYGGPSGALTPPNYLTTPATLMPQGPPISTVPGEINMDALRQSGLNTGFNINPPVTVPSAPALKPTIIDDIAYTNDNTFMQLNDVVDTTGVPAGVDTTATQTGAGGPAGVDAAGAAVIPPGVDTTAAGTRAAAEAIRPPTTWESVKDIFTDTGVGDKGYFTATKDFLCPSSVTPTEIVAQQLGVVNPAGATWARLDAANIVSRATLNDMITEAASLLTDNAAAMGGGYNPGFLQKWGPLAAAGTGIMAATGGFEQQEIGAGDVTDPFGLGGQSGWDLLEADPGKYRVFSQGAPYSVPTGAHGGDVTRFMAHRNTGGSFPSRDGAIAGPGTGTSDDIRAMLSDGEFVMTARAVEGAGNGDRRRGVRKMYEVMRGFEGVA